MQIPTVFFVHLEKTLKREEELANITTLPIISDISCASLETYHAWANLSVV